MAFGSIIERLLPGESDAKLQDFLARLSYPVVNTVAAMEMAAPFLMLLGRLAIEPAFLEKTSGLGQALALALVGALTMALSRCSWSRRHARLLSGISVWAACSLFLWAAAWAAPSADEYTLAGTALVLITAAAVVPFRPLEILATGLAIEATWLAAGWLPEISVAAGHRAAHHVFVLVLVFLATGISKTNYDHLRAEFTAHQQAVRVAEALAGAQLRAQLAENAISIGKLAATLMHEINTPLGAMRSSIETLLALTGRQADAPPAKREILAKMRAELCRSIAESGARIEDVMGRLHRFVGLEEAEFKSADVNELVSDVSLLYQEQVKGRRIRLEFDLERPLPSLMCRPQLLSAVFSILLSNAINAVNGVGAIGISTRRQDSKVEVTVRDNGRGMTAEEAEGIFDPSFKIADGRVSGGNWSLFNMRQIIYEHGGDIRVHSALGQGTIVHVSLPLAP
jgi:signal transduction histidine kinase